MKNEYSQKTKPLENMNSHLSTKTYIWMFCCLAIASGGQTNR